jgi:ferredoxin
LKKNNIENWFPLYTNYKEAAILAGLGVRARNSLIYSYKFGFDCHIAAVGFEAEIIDLPTNRRVNGEMWRRCQGCSDCAKACPVGAIQNEKKPYWLNSTKCEDFIGYGDHPTIPSIKQYWHKNVYPEETKEFVDSLKGAIDGFKVFNNGPIPFDKNGYAFDGNIITKDGKAVNVPFCRECTSQPRCSKWGGKYPYDEILNETIDGDWQPIKFKRGIKIYFWMVSRRHEHL